jgi:sec-independent protein translocase protein TatA
MFNLGAAEMAVIAVIGLLLFGNRLPEIARSVGKFIVEFRREAGNLTEEFRGPLK